MSTSATPTSTTSTDSLNFQSIDRPENPKQVRFENLIRITLIPCCKEYEEAGLKSGLWLSQEELQECKDDAYNEIKGHADKKNMSFNEALADLFKKSFLPDE